MRMFCLHYAARARIRPVIHFSPSTMNSISGSAHFHNKADYGISIWRDPSDTSTPSQCHIEKVRFSETGKPGKIKFRYNVLTRHIEEVNDRA